MNGWIGVDFDGTLAEYHGWKDYSAGPPIMPMVERVQEWLAAGREVRILTARVCSIHPPEDKAQSVAVIDAFCLEQFGQTLPITAEKDFKMEVLWDDRAVHVEINTGRILG